VEESRIKSYNKSTVRRKIVSGGNPGRKSEEKRERKRDAKRKGVKEGG